MLVRRGSPNTPESRGDWWRWWWRVTLWVFHVNARISERPSVGINAQDTRIADDVYTIKADPDRQPVRISLEPTLLSQKIAGTGFEPATSGL